MPDRTFSEKRYDDIEEYEADWLAAFRQAGHEPSMIDGVVDQLVRNTGNHNGPGCRLSGESWCWHCTPPWKIVKEKCPGPSHAVASRRRQEDAILAEADAIRERRAKEMKVDEG